MGAYQSFLKQNKKKRETVKYAATKSLVDEKGKPLLWTVKPLSSKDMERIRSECTTSVQVPGRRGQFMDKTDSYKLNRRILVEAVVYPDLYDRELQDSYGVMTPEELIVEMVDDLQEYSDFIDFAMGISDSGTLSDKVEEAKN